MKESVSTLVRAVLLLAIVFVGWTATVKAEGCKYCLRVGGAPANCYSSAQGSAAPALDICGTKDTTHCSYICMGPCCSGGFGDPEEVEGEEVPPENR